jgi:uncharacterized protein YcaQ
VLKLSLNEARQLALRAQGLAPSLQGGKPAFGSGKSGALTAIRHLGYVQLDTISVVERAHHHVLWSRVPDYDPGHLNALQKNRSIFEYWYHAASYLPIEDYRYCLPRMRLYAKGKSHFLGHDKKASPKVLARIRAEGPLQSKDLEAPSGKKTGPWFDWKPEKRAVEHLFMSGVLMISERKGFQKVYDLTERVLPSHVDTSTPTELELAKYLVRSTIRSHGIALEPEMRYLRQGIQKAVRQALDELLEEGELVPVQIQSLEGLCFYARASELKKMKLTDSSDVQLLSPFDPAVIQRKRTKTLFDFDYQIECYVPGPKRKYGYFCLPLLSGTEFLGRIDAKADRKSKTLQILSIHAEYGGSMTDERYHSIAKKIDQFAAFNLCDVVHLARNDKLVPPRWAQALREGGDSWL